MHADIPIQRHSGTLDYNGRVRKTLRSIVDGVDTAAYSQSIILHQINLRIVIDQKAVESTRLPARSSSSHSSSSGVSSRSGNSKHITDRNLPCEQW